MRIEIASAVHHAKNLDRIGRDPIKSQVLPNDDVANAGCNIVS